MTPLAAYVLLFIAVGAGFIFVHLMAGKFIRPSKPDPEKLTTYECGEPTIGSAWIQFDLRFYVVALLFVIFDVEVAFFFPWAVVFGKTNALVALGEPKTAEEYHEMGAQAWDLLPPAARSEHGPLHERMLAMTSADLDRFQQLKQKDASKRTPAEITELDHLESPVKRARDTHRQARTFSWLALLEILVFFGVLLVGFAYLWRRGDLAWVRSLAAEEPNRLPPPISSPTPPPQSSSTVLAGSVAHS